MPDYNSILASYRNKLAEQRLLLNQWVSVVMTQYDKLPEDVRKDLPSLPGSTAKELVPSLFHDPVTAEDEADYPKQIKVLQDFVAACNRKIAEINASEAVRCKLS